jgi:RecJ-like exonuclease
MERVVAYCGIICSDCPTFKATRMDDDAERRRVAKQWTKQYDKEFKMEDINCDGCLTEGLRVFSYCNVCEIRKCAKERKVENCAYCGDYACEKLSKLFDEFGPAKEVLDEIRASPKKRD